MASLFCYPTKRCGQFTVSLLILTFLRLTLISSNNFRTASTLLKPVSSLLNIKWELRGAEHISEKKSVIMVANHQTSLGKFFVKLKNDFTYRLFVNFFVDILGKDQW